MIVFSTIDTALKTWLAAITGIPTTSILIAGAAAPLVNRPYAEISYYNLQKVGIDEIVYEDDDPTTPTAIRPNVSGVRILDAQIRVVTRDNRPDYSAYYYGELILAALRKPRFLAILQAVNVSINAVNTSLVTPTSFQERTELQAIIDLRLNVTSTDTTTADDDTSWIETVEVEGDLKIDSTVLEHLEEILPL